MQIFTSDFNSFATSFIFIRLDMLLRVNSLPGFCTILIIIIVILYLLFSLHLLPLVWFFFLQLPEHLSLMFLITVINKL